MASFKCFYFVYYFFLNLSCNSYFVYFHSSVIFLHIIFSLNKKIKCDFAHFIVCEFLNLKT
jgi:hypothetical protein